MKTYITILTVLLLGITSAHADYEYYNDNNNGYYNNSRSSYFNNKKDVSTFSVRPSVGLDYVYSDVFVGDDLLRDYVGHRFNSFNVSLGLRFGQYIGLEAFYQKSDDAEKDVYGFNVATNFYAYGADLNFYIPTQFRSLEVLVALGAGQYEFEAELKGLASESEKKFAPRAGLGLQYNINEYIGIRGMGRIVWLNSDYVDDIQELSIGARVYF